MFKIGIKLVVVQLYKNLNLFTVAVFKCLRATCWVKVMDLKKPLLLFTAFLINKGEHESICDKGAG